MPEGVATLTGPRGKAGPGEVPAVAVTSLSRAGSEGASFFSIWGGKSVVLCFPVVQGSISRNSSKVKTRGLQHFHPVPSSVSTTSCKLTNRWENISARTASGGVRTFLAFVEDGWTWMISACLLRILDFLAASLVDALGSHRGAVGLQWSFVDEAHVVIDQLRQCAKRVKLQAREWCWKSSVNCG